MFSLSFVPVRRKMGGGSFFVGQETMPKLFLINDSVAPQ